MSILLTVGRNGEIVNVGHVNRRSTGERRRVHSIAATSHGQQRFWVAAGGELNGADFRERRKLVEPVKRNRTRFALHVPDLQQVLRVVGTDPQLFAVVGKLQSGDPRVRQIQMIGLRAWGGGVVGRIDIDAAILRADGGPFTVWRNSNRAADMLQRNVWDIRMAKVRQVLPFPAAEFGWNAFQ